MQQSKAEPLNPSCKPCCFTHSVVPDKSLTQLHYILAVKAFSRDQQCDTVLVAARSASFRAGQRQDLDLAAERAMAANEGAGPSAASGEVPEDDPERSRHSVLSGYASDRSASNKRAKPILRHNIKSSMVKNNKRSRCICQKQQLSQLYAINVGATIHRMAVASSCRVVGGRSSPPPSAALIKCHRDSGDDTTSTDDDGDGDGGGGGGGGTDDSDQRGGRRRRAERFAADAGYDRTFLGQ